MSSLFISDLHLDPSRPAIVRAFLSFLEQASSADALYILGDFFEVWIGDDDDCEFNRSIIDALKQFTDTGTPCYIMHGNRDFLMGEQFCRDTGCKLLDDPIVIDLYGKQVLLMHGDSLCTLDEKYMEFRREVRDKAWQDDFLGKPLQERRDITNELRNRSKNQTKDKQEDILDVTPEEVVTAMDDAMVDLMIHGHTHRPMIHELSTAQGDSKRIVLGDWYKSGWVLRYEDGGEYSLEEFGI